MFSRRTFTGLAVGTVLSVGLAATVSAQGPTFFRIGTGGTAGTYYPVGGMISNIVSNPPNLIVTAQASNGSVANVNSVVSGQLEMRAAFLATVLIAIGVGVHWLHRFVERRGSSRAQNN